MPNYRLDLAYIGSNFHGYASQPGIRTVQDELETALFHHTGRVETAVAGRTDKGVHAVGQVVNFRCDTDLNQRRVMRSLNKQLAPDIAVTKIEIVSDDFHARFSAMGRHYRYLILTRFAPDPFLAQTAWHYGSSLDIDAMNAAADRFVGEMDFASLCRRSGETSTVRLVRRVKWYEIGPELLCYEVEASSFCHQMVRSMVSLCVDVGRGKIDQSEVISILLARDRGVGRGAAPAHGLALMKVDYPSQ